MVLDGSVVGDQAGSHALLQVGFLHGHSFALASKKRHFPSGSSRDGYCGTAVRMNYVDFWGESYLEKLEAKAPNLGPFLPEHDYGIATTPASEGEPQGRQGCVIDVSKHPVVYEAMTRYGLVKDTGRRAVMGYHETVE